MRNRIQTRGASLVLLLLASAPLASAPSAWAIRGGAKLPVSAYPGVGYLEPACTATLINANTAITANHCVRQAFSVENLKFTYADPEGKERTLQAIRTVSLSEELPQELALVRFRGRATGVQFVTPWTGAPAPKGTEGVIVGYGATDRLPRSVDKRGGKVLLDASRKLGGHPMVPVLPGAAPRSSITCGGDSGGPLIVNGMLYGVASFGASRQPGFEMMGSIQQCMATESAYYVPVAPHLDWIKKALATLDRD